MNELWQRWRLLAPREQWLIYATGHGRNGIALTPVTAATVWAGLPLAWLPWAVALGVAVHIAGDAITKQGLPGPRGSRVGPRLITTGGTAETVVCIILAAAIAAYPLRGHLAALIEGAIT